MFYKIFFTLSFHDFGWFVFFSIRAITSNLTTVVFPFFEWFVQGIAIAAIIYFGLQLWTVGEPIHKITKMNNDTKCICSGEAINYTKNNAICKPQIFTKYCHQNGSTNNCEFANCSFSKYEPPQIVAYYKVSAYNMVLN